MRVSELIAELTKLPQDAEVILSSDSEGNRYDTAYEIAVAHYDPDDEIYPIFPNELADYDVDDLAVAVFIWP